MDDASLNQISAADKDKVGNDTFKRLSLYKQFNEIPQMNFKLQKIVLLITSLILIAFIWIFSIFLIGIETKILLNFKDSFSEHSNTTNALNGLIQQFANETDNYTFLCPGNYEFSSSFPYCSPSCIVGDYCSNKSCFDFHHALIAILDILAIFLSIFILISWPFVKEFWEFPQITIFFVMISFTALALTFSIGDIPGPAYYCDANGEYSFDDVNVIFQDRLIGQGVILHFLRYCILIWVTSSLLNIVISIESSIHHYKLSKNTKILIISIEGVISLIIPTVFCIGTLASNSKYIYEYFGSFPGFQTVELFVIGRSLPDYLTIISTMTLVIYILARFRWLYLSSHAVLGSSGRPVSQLEKRLLIYCILNSIIFIFFIAQTIWFLTISTEEFVTIFNSRACVTLNSPVQGFRNSQQFQYNATYELISPSIWQNGSECNGLDPHYKALSEILIVYNGLYRVERLMFFLVFILKANLLVWFNWIKLIGNSINIRNQSVTQTSKKTIESKDQVITNQVESK